MESKSGSHNVDKLLKAQTLVWNHTFSFLRPLSLKCAIDLGIPDVIHNYGKPMPLSKLTSSLSIHPSKTSSIQRLMRILTHSGFFITTQKSDDSNDEIEIGYVLSDASMLLTKDNPFSIRPLLVAALDPILGNPSHHFSNWFKNDDSTPFETEHGKGFWEYCGQLPKINHLFNDAMACDARLVTSVVIDKCKGVFEGLESLVDVGGGTGTMAKALAKEFPKMECIVFDLPHVVAGLEGCHNLKFVGGNMFESIPPSDAIMLKWILHDWSDEECLNILRKCKESIMSKGKEGKVMIIDMVVMEDGNEDDESLETQLLFDMQMMMLVTGKERNEKEWNNLFFSAGFTSYKITSALGIRSLIEIYP